ncbi:uncharacterized protein DNG_04826 [Cephalotrichum gorgonifer]|uniref:BRCT domain-containing protein n=1 Tax=Cephalotrichum gorgonifer TaxID=2041049 RepID=A0AAE8MZA4_9PEZI|nr:uncharacterized protein DNG_04826 [Cephalotrichum gorgonifer]
MEPQSPPKRITRSRAAKASEPAPKPTKSTTTTAASRAKAVSGPTASTKAASAKRKTRADENENENDEATAPVMKTARPRGRPKKTEEPVEGEKPTARRSATAPTATSMARAMRTTRTKTVAAEPAEQEEEPAKPKRGRPKKVVESSEETKAAAEPAKTTARSRAASTTKPASKKTVTFQEPEKENIDPGTAKGKQPETKPTTGIRGRPVRRTAATTTTASTTATSAAPKTTAATTVPARTTRGARTTRTVAKAPGKIPLSPRKTSQVTIRDMSSDDELAGPEKTPLKKKPLRPPPSSALVKSKKTEIAAAAAAEERTSPVKNAAAPEEREAPSNVLASPAKRPPPTPFKDAIKSPAKRAEGMQLFSAPSAAKSGAQQQAGGSTPFKASLLQSPAKRPQAGLLGRTPSSSLARGEQVSSTPLKTSLMQTPARRPGSVLKAFASARQDAAQSPVTKATILSTPIAQAKASDLLMDGEEAEGVSQPRNLFAEPVPSLKFPGRLSAVLPRDANPVLDMEMATVEEATEDEMDLLGNVEMSQEVEVEEASVIQAPADQEPADAEEEEDEDHEMSDILDISPPAHTIEEPIQQHEESIASAATTTPPNSPPKSLPRFSLRQKELNPFQGLDEDSDDELTSSFQRNYKSPSPVRTIATPSAARAPAAGFTPLVAKFGAWGPSSPVKRSETVVEETTVETPMSTTEDHASKQTFFDDEMCVRDQDEANAIIEAAIEADVDAQLEPVFDDVAITNEDIALANEAEEMSLMESEMADETAVSQDYDDTLSEASQDYGDENQMPREEATIGVPPQTPARMIGSKAFHTVSKVPLKGADHHTPSPVKQRRHSISRLPVQRPAPVNRSATVISYSPTKKDARSAPGTPAKESVEEVWSTTGTPTRTPRKDLDAGLLRGAVVYVDVRTSDGGDASEFFAELLTEMGARCVKRWDWSPSADDSSRVGITHVVYKDGGKRTLEKVREARGVVQCVGVSWVLECERNNEWVDEGPYHVDTEHISHGPSRRRKTMEPKAIANLAAVPLGSGPSSRRSEGHQSAPNTPLNRRDSSVWIRTPSEQADEEREADREDWDLGVLTPVPFTPAPEAIARYVEGITDTPSEDGGEDASPMDDKKLVMMTCPAKKAGPVAREEVFSAERDGTVMMRLMAARRKSLQFAPKVASPLSKAWGGPF